MFSRSFHVPTRLSLIPVMRFSSVTHSYMADKIKTTPTGSVEPIMPATSNMDEEWAMTNSDADTTSTQQQQQQQQRDMSAMSMSMMDEQAKEKVENMEKEDWTFEAEAMSQDIHSSRGQKSSPDTDYM